MASAAGIAPNTVSNILSGNIDIPPEQRLMGFAKALGLSMSSINAAVKRDGGMKDNEKAETMDEQPSMIDTFNALSEEEQAEFRSAIAVNDEAEVSEEVVEEVEATEEAPEAEQAEEAPEVQANEDTEKEEMLEEALKIHREVKAEVISGIKANSHNLFSDEELEAKKLDELRKIAEIANVKANYAGAQGAPVVNKEDDAVIPATPAIFADDK
jgi:transcriptional regulator with XRE-family HTH domain